jgi:hypothetical protein
VEGGKRIETLMDDMEAAAGKLASSEHHVWLWLCERDAVMRRSKLGALYTWGGVFVTTNMADCSSFTHCHDNAKRGRGCVCRCYPVFGGTVAMPAAVAEVAEAVNALNGAEAWAVTAAPYLRFDATVWRLWRTVLRAVGQQARVRKEHL